MGKCPSCGSSNTKPHNPPTMKQTKDRRCVECGHTFNDNSRSPKGYSFL